MLTLDLWKTRIDVVTDAGRFQSVGGDYPTQVG
jgi:hypothetical protein